MKHGKKIEDLNLDELRPFAMRHNLSGVWIGYLVGPGSFEGTIEVYGRKLWSWTGKRLEPSQIARIGALSSDRLGDVCFAEIGITADNLVEFYTMEHSVVDRSLALPAWEEG